MGRYYVLRDDEVVEEPDFAKWIAWHQASYEDVRCVAHTEMKFGVINTIFLGMNMKATADDPPLLFDTRVKGGWLDRKWGRSSTRKEALAVHEAFVTRVKEMEAENEDPPPDCAVW